MNVYTLPVTPFPGAGFIRVSRASDAGDGVFFRIDASSRLFDGHFDGAPILPGVAHVALALSACAERGIAHGALQGLRDVRFSSPLEPGDEVEVVVVDGGDEASVRFDIRARGRSATSGLLIFGSSHDGRG